MIRGAPVPARSRQLTGASAAAERVSWGVRAGRRGSRPAEAAASRERILDVAIKHVVEVGCGKVSFASLARRAAVSRGAVLHHFPSSVELLAAIVEHAARRLSTALDAVAVRAPSLTASGRVDAALQEWWSAPAVALCELGLHARGVGDLEPTLAHSAMLVEAAWARACDAAESPDEAFALDCTRHAARWAVIARQHRAPGTSLGRVFDWLRAEAGRASPSSAPARSRP